jgi:sugar phosphate isomerase/epimerase
LYTVREALANDFTGVVQRVADIGYVGVETAGLPNVTAQEASQIFRNLGLTVAASHTLLPLGEAKEEVLETMSILGCRHIVSPAMGPVHYTSLDEIKRTCDTFNEANAVANANGLSFSIHNHWWEFEPVEGHYPYQVLLEYLDPAVLFEVDVYWVQTAGLDPIAVIKELGPRVRLLHVKDGPAVKDEPMVAVGDGLLDIPAIIEAGQDNTEWLIVELDKSDSDIMAAVLKSYDYLVGSGLAYGKS